MLARSLARSQVKLYAATKPSHFFTHNNTATARLQRQLDQLHLAVCSHGGVPHHDGDQLLVPLPLAQRGVS